MEHYRLDLLTAVKVQFVGFAVMKHSVDVWGFIYKDKRQMFNSKYMHFSLTSFAFAKP